MDTFNTSPMPTVSVRLQLSGVISGENVSMGIQVRTILCFLAVGCVWPLQGMTKEADAKDHTGQSIRIQSNPVKKARKLKVRKKGQSVQKGSVRVRGNTRVKTSHMDTIEPKPQKSVHIRSNDHRRSQTLDVQQGSRSVEGEAVTIVGNPNVDGSTGDQLNANADEAKKKGSEGKTRRKTKKRAKTRNAKSRRRSR